MGSSADGEGAGASTGHGVAYRPANAGATSPGPYDHRHELKQVCERSAWADAVHHCRLLKGSGMMAPNMATMLAYFTTDRASAAPALRSMLGG